LFINLAQLLIIKAFPSQDSLHAHPGILSLLKFSLYDPRSSGPPCFPIAMVSKPTTITKPYAIQVSTKVIGVVMAYEHSLHISHGDKGLQDPRIHSWTRHSLLKLAYNLFVEQFGNFWDRDVEKCKCGGINCGNTISRMKRILILSLLVCDQQDVNGVYIWETSLKGIERPYPKNNRSARLHYCMKNAKRTKIFLITFNPSLNVH